MPQALCFDMYGTVCDTASVEEALAERVDAPRGFVSGLSSLWRRTQLTYAYQVALMDDYRPFWELTAAALDYALAYYGVDARAIDKDAVLGAYESLEPFADVLPTLKRLQTGSDRDRLAILSNGNPDMLETLAENVGIAAQVDQIVSADEVRTYKPAPAVYENAAARLDVAIDQCWLLSSNAWDVAGAAHAGMGAVYVNRSNEPIERIGGKPDLIVDSLADVSESLE